MLLLVLDPDRVADIGHHEARIADLLLDPDPARLGTLRTDFEYESPRLVVPVAVFAAVLHRWQPAAAARRRGAGMGHSSPVSGET